MPRPADWGGVSFDSLPATYADMLELVNVDPSENNTSSYISYIKQSQLWTPFGLKRVCLLISSQLERILVVPRDCLYRKRNLQLQPFLAFKRSLILYLLGKLMTSTTLKQAGASHPGCNAFSWRRSLSIET